MTDASMPSIADEEEHCVKFAASSIVGVGAELPTPAFALEATIPLISAFAANVGKVSQIYDSDQWATHILPFISKRSVVITV